MKIKTKYMVSLLGIIVVLSMNGYACTVQNPCYPHDPTKTLTQSCPAGQVCGTPSYICGPPTLTNCGATPDSSCDTHFGSNACISSACNPYVPCVPVGA